MNQVIHSFNSESLTMSSREIAQVVESRHDKVKQSIERLANRKDSNGKPAPVIDLPPMGEYLDSLGRRATEYHVNKRDSYVVVAQLSPEFTARLVDRWQELEQGGQAKLPQTMAEALRLAADQAEQLEQQQKAIEAAKPAVDFVERYVSADSGSKGFRQVCKLLNANERQFRQFLESEKVMYLLGGEWMPYRNHIEAGRFEVKAGVAENDHAYNTTKFTAKGVNWIAGKWAIYNLQEAA